MLVVRDASLADLPAILAIYNHAIETTTAVFSYAPHTLQMRREWFADKQARGCKFGRWLDLTFVQVVLDTPAAPRET